MTRRDFLRLSGCALIAPTLPGFTRLRRADTKLEFKFDPLVDLYCFMRKEIAGYSQLTGPWIEPLESMRKASRMLPARISFALLDGYVADAENLDNLRRLAFSAPELGPQDIPIREPLGHVLSALRKAMPAYESQIQAGHQKVVDERRKEVEVELAPKMGAAVDFILEGLRLQDTGVTVPIFLVGKCPPPGGFTSRSRQYGAACFVQVEGFPGSLFDEVVLHEATHAFEVAAAAGKESVMDLLRRELSRRGKGPSDPLYRDVPHTLMFVHSAEAVRRFIEPKHRDYGELNGYYGRLEKVSSAVRANWHEHLAGKLPVEAAIEAMVQAVAPKAPA